MSTGPGAAGERLMEGTARAEDRAALPPISGCRSPSCPRTSSRDPWRSAGQERAVRARPRPFPGPVTTSTYLVGAIVLSHLLAQQKDALVPLQLLIQRLVERVPHRHLRDTGCRAGRGHDPQPRGSPPAGAAGSRAAPPRLASPPTRPGTRPPPPRGTSPFPPAPPSGQS